MRRSTLALLGAMLALSACLSTSEPYGPEQNYGFVFLHANSVDGQFVTEPNAVFYRTSRLQLPSTSGLNEGCIVGIFNPDQTGGESPPNISAGPTIELGLSGQSYNLTPVTDLEETRYLYTDGGVVPYTPGNVATVEIPGDIDGFPSWTFQGKTAEPFTPTEVETPVDPVTIPLRWTAATSGGSKMIVSLRYAAPNDEGMNQVYCELVDDGAYDLEPQLTSGWRNASAGDREAVWARWRITAEASAGSALLIVSTFQVPFDAAQF